MTRAAIALAVALVVAGCTHSARPAAGGPTATTAPTTTAPTASSPSATSATGCPASPEEAAPAGAATNKTIDVDGDGRPDTAWFAPADNGVRRFGITTASGRVASVDVPLAGPTALRAMVVDADERPPAEIIVSDGRTALLYVFTRCEVVRVTNPQGGQYAFDLGFRGTGTGVGCVDADRDGRRDLVGLLRIDERDGVVRWSRTIIRLDGTHAANGARDTGTFTRPRDDAAIELLSTISCGDETIADGVTEAE